jgi:putative peptide zinc metalloprotease protein
LVVVFLINLDILFQCLPFVRFDGYWALADLAGIPDFFSQMGAFVLSVVPIPAWKGNKLPKLKPWV